MVATKLGSCKQTKYLGSYMESANHKQQQAWACMCKNKNSMHRAKIDWKQHRLAQPKRAQHQRAQLKLNINISKLWETVQHGRSNKAPRRQNSHGSNRGNQTTVVAAARYMQRIQASNRPHKAVKRYSQVKVTRTCYFYGMLNELAGSAVASADWLPKFDFGFQVH